MFFFEYLNKIITDDYGIITNLSERFTIIDKILENPDSHFLYNLKDWDTPENIAKRYYGNEKYSWLLLLTNRALTDNPFSCFYRSSRELFLFCKEKYGIHLYDIAYLKDTDSTRLDEVESFYYFNKPLKLKNRTVIPMTYLDVESEKNESAKVIKIINPEFLTQIESEINDLFVKNNYS